MKKIKIHYEESHLGEDDTEGIWIFETDLYGTGKAVHKAINEFYKMCNKTHKGALIKAIYLDEF